MLISPRMSFEADLLIDRRRLKRRLTAWRVAALFAGIALLAVLFREEAAEAIGARESVARLTVAGPITEDRRLIEAIERARRDDSVRALLLVVDSPGGSVAGGEALHGAISRFREQKPVVALLTGTAASAGYMIALPASRIYARESTVTGSIGVILQSFETSELLARLGVRPETIASGRLKDQPSPFRPLSEEGRAALAAVVDDLHGQFVRMVAAGRGLDEARVRQFADGRVMTGRVAREMALVDAIGGEREARAWLAESAAIPAGLPARDINPRRGPEEAFGLALGIALKNLVSEWLGVDGFRAVWQPSPHS
jgi:protease IV